ncbi:DUF2190 family protein [Camelimonas fluminis]|uniref:DUF2190 family protein n=1 Tax=Camelimonas fluminis TaxID=1576911 RepID=A0ABV7UG26_9HYPH|nr:DUF2190 family protein [Camelimonas fluminis]
MKNMVQRGHSMTVTATAAVKSGDLVLSGLVPGIAYTDAANGEEFEAATDGVFDLPKAAGAITIGAKVYFDAAAKNVTTTASGNTAIGHAWAAAAAGAASVPVKLAAL